MFDHMSVGDLVSMASEQPFLPAEDEAGLARRIHEGDREALRELVTSNLRIAIDEAIRARGLGTSQRALVRIGLSALVDAAHSYDPLRDGPFAAHARALVRGRLIASLAVS